jgi:HSP20 family protein
MQLTRLDPFLELDHIQQRLNRLFLDPTLKTPEPPFANFMPAVDIQETDGEFIVKADLPDVKKEEVKVHVHDGVLAIEGERRKEKEEKGKRFHKVEREYGKFIRRFTMPTEIDSEKVRAEFKEGVLTVFLPKAPNARPKMIDVTVE